MGGLPIFFGGREVLLMTNNISFSATTFWPKIKPDKKLYLVVYWVLNILSFFFRVNVRVENIDFHL